MPIKVYEKLDSDIMEQLREAMNDGLVYVIYSDYKNKDMWSIICSAMDWIQVAIGGIEPSKVINAEGLEASRQMALFVSCIELLRQAVEKLNIVFGVGSKDKNFTKVFLKSPLYKFDNSGNNRIHFAIPNITDDYHFDTIRSCFAAHPVELYGRYNGDRKEKRYAQWSTDDFSGDADFTVTLYSDEPRQPNVYLQVYFDELMAYAQQRYEHILVIIDKATRKNQTYIELFKGKLLAKEPETPEQWSKLSEFSREYVDNGENACEFVNLEFLFNEPITNSKNAEIVKVYRSLINRSVDMGSNNDNLWGVCPCDFYPTYREFCNLLFLERLYDFNDEFLANNAMSNLEYIVADWIVCHLKGIVDIKKEQDIEYLEWSSNRELYVLVQTGLYFMQNPSILLSGGDHHT